MEKVEPILTICIPTYNREKELKGNLDALCPYLTDDVKVLVRDNCSTKYDVHTVTKPYEDKYGIKVVRNKVNVGMNANIAKAFEECDTDWLWVLGDDDFVIPEAIHIVIDTIKQHSDALYLKFNSDVDRTVIGINGFCEAMKPIHEFAGTFFISETVHNIKKTKDYTYWHYELLSSMIGQILRVIKCLIDRPEEECVFVKTRVLQEHGEDITWNHTHLVYAYLYVFDKFRDYRKLFKDNIFRSMAGYCLTYIIHSNMTARDKIYFINMLTRKYGIINTIRYLNKTIIHAYLSALRIVK